MTSKTRYVIIGGGIAGVSCAKTIRMLTSEKDSEVVLLSPASIVKSVRNLSQITQSLAEFQVEETEISQFSADFPGLNIERCAVKQIHPNEHFVLTDKNEKIHYDKLCVCTGARPNLIDQNCPYVIGIRDTETVKDLELRLQHAKKVLIVGNGGIALEIAYALRDIEVVWAIKDDSIGTPFVDCGASQFLISELATTSHHSDDHLTPNPQRAKFTVFNLSNNTSSQAETATGSALGPDWHEHAFLKGSGQTTRQIEYECRVEKILLKSEMPSEKVAEFGDWPVYAQLTNGKTIGCDFIVSATGVVPNSEIFENLDCNLSSDGGVKVDDNMRVIGLQDVYAAGDVCVSAWEPSPHWLQMRLWTQARQMGIFAAQSMVSHVESKTDIPLDFCFEIFAHVTRFFGNKVVLLGKFNAQGLEKSETKMIVRVTPGREYVKVVLRNDRMYGALMVGDTDLEETFENLILNGMDLSHYGENLLHPNVDVEDYFD